MIKQDTGEQKCIDCSEVKTLDQFPVSNIHKLKVTKRCADCQRLKNSKKTAGQVVRKQLKELDRTQKSRKKTPQQERRAEEEKLYQKVRKEVLDEQHKEHGFVFCEVCGYSTKERYEIQTHHLLHRSLCHDTEILHSKQNLLASCAPCHSQLHRDHALNDHYIRERYLDKQHYEDELKNG